MLGGLGPRLVACDTCHSHLVILKAMKQLQKTPTSLLTLDITNIHSKKRNNCPHGTHTPM
jgi:hypothetical protein